MGESEIKSKEPILLSVKVADKKFVLGTLSMEKIPQLTFDLVFEKEFELTHNWKHGSIYLCGYQTYVGDQYPLSFHLIVGIAYRYFFVPFRLVLVYCLFFHL